MQLQELVEIFPRLEIGVREFDSEGKCIGTV